MWCGDVVVCVVCVDGCYCGEVICGVGRRVLRRSGGEANRRLFRAGVGID